MISVSDILKLLDQLPIWKTLKRGPHELNQPQPNESQIMIRFSAIIAVTALAGCKTIVSTDLYTSDLIAASAGEELTAAAVLSLESPTMQKCKETAPAVLSAVQTQLQSAEFIGCENESFDTFARFRVQTKIIANADASTVIGRPFAIGVKESEIGFLVSYLANPEAARAIWDAMPEELTKYETFEFNTRLRAVLNNDLRDAVVVTTDDVFADGNPIQGTASRQLPRRDQIEIEMSDVTNSAFGTVANQSHIVQFMLP